MSNPAPGVEAWAETVVIPSYGIGEPDKNPMNQQLLRADYQISNNWRVTGRYMWHSNKQVTGMWVNDQERNAYVYLDGVGWRKIGGDDAGSFLNILAQLTSAKSGGRPVNAFEDSGQITQVYVF